MAEVAGSSNDARASLARRLRVIRQFLAYLAERFESDRCLRAAAALAYTSLLALVPLFTVVFVTLSAFPAFQDWRVSIEHFLFRNFVPALGEQVQGYLVEFSDKARGLQTVGVLVLVATVLSMLSTIETAFNVIWGVHRRRPMWLRFLVYWAVLTLGPVLIGIGLVATSYLVSLPFIAGESLATGLSATLLTLLPLIATAIAFVLCFKLIPYRPVPFRHALAGGLVAAVLFELAKHGFALFVTRFPSQEAIYGAFATVPMFLTWLYLSWVIVLLGAEITRCLTTFRPPRARQHAVLGDDDPLYCVFRVLLHLARAQERGHALSDRALVREEPDLGYAAIDAALDTLDRAGWVTRNENFAWMLARDVDRLTLLDLLRLAPSFPTEADVVTLADDPPDLRLHGQLLALARWSDTHLDTPLAALFAGQPERTE